MASDIILSNDDHTWLGVLDALLEANDKQSRSQKRALEYFYRAWFLDPRERFPSLCMALDSLVCAESHHTKAALNFVKDLIDIVDTERLRLLLRLRGAVVHGAAPDVYDSESYEKYYVEYDADPIHDLELVIAKCLRESIFRGTLKVHRASSCRAHRASARRGKISEEN